jgi:MFS family permease
MTATTIALGPMSEAEHQSALRRAVIASTVGTTIEWYDFLIYSTVTGLVFNKVYFPGSDPWIGTLQAFGVYFVGFVARPIGAAIFGHYGDRIGRKATLIVTLLMTGIATAAVGLVPGYDSIGIWGAVILTMLRLIQGIGVGGEWGGSVLLAMEWAQTNKNRGFITSWPQFGAPAGLFLANVAVLFFSWYSGDQFLTWGWRIPFLMSIVDMTPKRTWDIRNCSRSLSKKGLARAARRPAQRGQAPGTLRHCRSSPRAQCPYWFGRGAARPRRC